MAGKAVISLTTGLEDPEKVTVAPMGMSAAVTAAPWPAPAGGWLSPMNCADSGNPR